MIVPSRSTKTAADSALAMFAVLSETSDKFISGHGSRSKACDHDCAAVVGASRCLTPRRSADELTGKTRYSSMPAASDMENPACRGWNVLSRVVWLTYH